MTTYNFGDVVLIGFPHKDMKGVEAGTFVLPILNRFGGKTHAGIR